MAAHALDATAAAAAAAALVVALVRIVVHAHAASDVTQTTREQRRWPPQPRRERLQSGTQKCRSSAFSAVDGEPTRVCLVSRCNASSGGGGLPRDLTNRTTVPLPDYLSTTLPPHPA